MTYFEIVSLVFGIISAVITLLMIHFIFFSIVGIFTHKKFPEAKKLHKYGIVISARNEDKVIGNLIKSIWKNEYPRELLDIFIVAHNCSEGDRTAEIARELGAHVYEYSNPAENTKGYALHYLFEQIEKDFGRKNFDGFICLDADNILSKDYIKKLNDAFDAGNCENVVTSFRNSKNFGTNLISGMYGIYFMTGCRLESRGRTVCGCSTRVQGTGFVIGSDVVRDGWNYVTLTEDWEFSADQILQGKKIVYCDEAVFYDEQPVTLKVMFRQRIRWSKGHLLVCVTRCKALLKSIFKNENKKNADGTRKKNNTFSKYDILINCLPVCIIFGCHGLLYLIFLAFVPLFEPNPQAILENWLIVTAIFAAISYAVTMLNAIAIFVLENKRIKNVNIFKRIILTLLWPLFLLVAFPLEFIALFSKNVSWKVIPHVDTTDFEKLNEGSEPDNSDGSHTDDGAETEEQDDNITDAADNEYNSEVASTDNENQTIRHN